MLEQLQQTHQHPRAEGVGITVASFLLRLGASIPEWWAFLPDCIGHILDKFATESAEQEALPKLIETLESAATEHEEVMGWAEKFGFVEKKSSKKRTVVVRVSDRS